MKKDDTSKHVSVADANRYVFCVEPEEGQNFWDANRGLDKLRPYAKFFKSVGKRRSGRIMHAIWQCYDPKSKAGISATRDESEVREDIAENFLNDKKFDWSQYEDIIDAFKNDCKTALELEMDYWREDLESRRKHYRTLRWKTDRKEKDSMLGSQKNLFKQYLEVLKEVTNERSEQVYHGGTQKSLLERQQS